MDRRCLLQRFGHKCWEWTKPGVWLWEWWWEWKRWWELRRWGNWEAGSHSYKVDLELTWGDGGTRDGGTESRPGVKNVQWQRWNQGHVWCMSCKIAALSFSSSEHEVVVPKKGLRSMSVIPSINYLSIRSVIRKAFKKCVGWNMLSDKNILNFKLVNNKNTPNFSHRNK